MQKLIDLRPADWALLEPSGSLKFISKDPIKAIEDLKVYLQKDPDDSWLLIEAFRLTKDLTHPVFQAQIVSSSSTSSKSGMESILKQKLKDGGWEDDVIKGLETELGLLSIKDIKVLKQEDLAVLKLKPLRQRSLFSQLVEISEMKPQEGAQNVDSSSAASVTDL